MIALGKDRVLLLRASLQTLAGHEVELATDPETSVILERLLYSMDDFARRVLADSFAGQWVSNHDGYSDTKSLYVTLQVRCARTRSLCVARSPDPLLTGCRDCGSRGA
jgi:hypothetical protein